MKAEILIARKQNKYQIRVLGRATFDCSPPLRSLANNLKNDQISAVDVDLGSCTGMDSTFMGILAMIGLEARKLNAPMTIINANESNLALLDGLGLKKLFEFKETNPFDEAEKQQWQEQKNKAELKESTETVLDAHKTLMDVDEKNVPKFENVVEFAEKDIQNLTKKSSS